VTGPDTVATLAAQGRAALDEDLREHLGLGAGTNATIAANRAAWDAVRFRPRVLTGGGTATTTTRLLGVDLALPVLLAPVGPVELIDPAGAAAVAAAAAEAGVFPVVALTSAPVLEEVADAAPGPKVFQLYWQEDDRWIEAMVRRVEDAGYAALCLTVDVTAAGVREHDRRRDYRHHDRMSLPNLADAPGGRLTRTAATSWADVARLRALTDLPLLLKGIQRADEAQRAAEIGVSAVWISNHGGRFLDHQRGTAEALAEIARITHLPVIVDGGVESAADVAKALALGAAAASLGKLQCWGLADGGASGLGRLLGALQAEVADTLTLLGAASVAELGRWAVA
jgi:isopentenyl diphosphate isomerase/L-lactate dehydrogenase-like FMN-dependent dehydrogenase